jgi:hypothetical protein
MVLQVIDFISTCPRLYTPGVAPIDLEFRGHAQIIGAVVVFLCRWPVL